MSDRLIILIAEDDPNDILLTKRAIAKSSITATVQHVRDGLEAINYLAGNGIYADRMAFPFPSCLMVDLKMPRKNGFDVLKWLRDHPKCCVIPTIVLSSSKQESDVKLAYQMGANTYFGKPSSAEDFCELIKTIFAYWKLAEKPAVPPGGKCE